MKKFLLLALLPLVALLPMCSGGGSDTPTAATPIAAADATSSGGTSTDSSSKTTADVRVYLTDKPAEDYQAVYVTIAKVRVHQSSDAAEQAGGWTDLAVTAAMPVDLLLLRNGTLLQLCQTALTAGQYQQIRLVLTANTGTEPPYNQSVVTADGTTHPLEVPSGTLKITPGFTVAAGQTADLTLDFDAAKSVVSTGSGKYSLKPVISATSSTSQGTSGTPPVPPPTP